MGGRMQWIDSYSGYDGQGEYTGLAKQLQQRGITKCVVVGLAFDFCVGSTALDSVSNGFEATILSNYTRSVSSESQKQMMFRCQQAGVKVVSSVEEALQ